MFAQSGFEPGPGSFVGKTFGGGEGSLEPENIGGRSNDDAAVFCVDQGFSGGVQPELAAERGGDADLALGGDGNQTRHTLSLFVYIIFVKLHYI